MLICKGHDRIQEPSVSTAPLPHIHRCPSGQRKVLLLRCLSLYVCYKAALGDCVGQARTRGLPDDHVGPVRVVTIEGIEDDLCCGTHVSSLAHLQAVKLLGTEKGKKGKVNVLFVAGERVLEWVARSYDKDKALTAYLKSVSPRLWSFLLVL